MSSFNNVYWLSHLLATLSLFTGDAESGYGTGAGTWNAAAASASAAASG
jgi:hypothetical protein